VRGSTDGLRHRAALAGGAAIGWQNPRMSRHPWSSRFTAWAVVCLLVLKAAVPMLAAGAAQARGIGVAEVCPIYGVALPFASQRHDAHGDAGHAGVHAGAGEEHPGIGEEPLGLGDHGPHGHAAQPGDHCALAGLASLAATGAALPAVTPAGAAPPGSAASAGVSFHDACAAWAARLRHGPPARA